VQAVFSLGDAEELCQLLTEAGFRHVMIEPASITARYANPEEFLAWEIDVDPDEIPALQSLDTRAQQAVLDAVRQDMQEVLQEAMQDGQLVLDTHAHIAHGNR
jgi:hypothetical protein